MKAIEIVEKLRSILLSAEEAPVVEELAKEEVVEVEEKVELEEKEEMPVEEPSSDEQKYATKEELESAVAQMKAMYDQIMEKLGSEEMETEVPQELSSQVEKEVELAAEDSVEPISHSPESVEKENFQFRISPTRPMDATDRVFAQLKNLK